MSKALTLLQAKLGDVDLLLAIHEHITGTARGRRGPEADVLNRSAIVLGVGAWEAYVEDVTGEAVEFLLKKAKSHIAFADGLKVRVAERLVQGRNAKGTKPLKYWELAGDGFRSLVKDALRELLDGFHTPDVKSTEQLFRTTLGLSNALGSRKGKTESLDTFIKTRHRIAHGRNTTVVKKTEVRRFRRCLETLAETVDERIADHVEKRLEEERARIEKERKKRPGRKPKAKRKRGRPLKLRPW